MSMHILAVGQDEYWLTAVQKAAAEWAGNPIIVKCPGNLLQCISSLPRPSTSTVVLVDASGQGDVEQVVAGLRARGWKYIIVVAADPSAKEATSVLRRNLGYDYWEKTYDEKDIHDRVEACLAEITMDLPLLTKQHERSSE
jgi:hypothetical protein